MSGNFSFSRERIIFYLKELAKDMRKRYPGTHIEIIVVGEASVIINYAFRSISYDIDAWFGASPSMVRESINAVGDKYELPNNWLNNDFMQTSSYTPKIIQFSKFYKTFSKTIDIRLVSAEYLIAMKIKSGRQYKRDLSDIVGIMLEESSRGNPMTISKIDKAMDDLYGGWEGVSTEIRILIDEALGSTDLSKLYKKLCDDETEFRNTLLEINQKYFGRLKNNNIDDVIVSAKNKLHKKDEYEREM